ncbi:MAG TPA: methyltransferase domain-containing protein [Acidimicrobiales bacterium]|nr:methyltransferase domain-containing protein [Acidimicrobiales bacterium]
MDQQQRVAKLFDEVADTYDNVGVEFFQPIASGLVAALRPRPGERALDIGCGRGAVLFSLATAVGSAGLVTGLDMSPRMVQATADDVARAGLNIEVRVGDAMAPDFPVRSFDVVASSLVLFFLPDPLAALQSWRELLVEGGRVGVSTFGAHDDRWAQKVDGVLQARAHPGNQESSSTGRRGPFGSDEGMERLLSSAGYRNVRTVTSVVTPRFEDCDHWYRWSMSAGFRRFWQAIPKDQLEEVKAEVLAAVDECRDENGRIGFDEGVRYTFGER